MKSPYQIKQQIPDKGVWQSAKLFSFGVSVRAGRPKERSKAKCVCSSCKKANGPLSQYLPFVALGTVHDFPPSPAPLQQLPVDSPSNNTFVHHILHKHIYYPHKCKQICIFALHKITTHLVFVMHVQMSVVRGSI